MNGGFSDGQNLDIGQADNGFSNSQSSKVVQNGFG